GSLASGQMPQGVVALIRLAGAAVEDHERPEASGRPVGRLPTPQALLEEVAPTSYQIRGPTASGDRDRVRRALQHGRGERNVRVKGVKGVDDRCQSHGDFLGVMTDISGPV